MSYHLSTMGKVVHLTTADRRMASRPFADLRPIGKLFSELLYSMIRSCLRRTYTNPKGLFPFDLAVVICQICSVRVCLPRKGR